MKMKKVPSERFEFPNRNDVLIRESPKFMQIMDLEAFSVQKHLYAIINHKYVDPTTKKWLIYM